MIIYKVQNKITGKVYIGQTIKSLEHRKKQHIKYSEKKHTRFLKALRLYGEIGFTWEIIDTAETKEELNEKEIYWINEYNSIETGYNMVCGGYNEAAVKANVKKRKGKTYEEIYSSIEIVNELKAKLRNNIKSHNKKYGFDVIDRDLQLKYAKMGANALNMSGYKHTEETKKKIGDSQRGITLEERYGKELADEHKKNISEKTKEAMKGLDWNDLMDKALKGRKLYWDNKHENDRNKILELRLKGIKSKQIMAILNISSPTYYARLNELKGMNKI